MNLSKELLFSIPNYGVDFDVLTVMLKTVKSARNESTDLKFLAFGRKYDDFNSCTSPKSEDSNSTNSPWGMIRSDSRVLSSNVSIGRWEKVPPAINLSWHILSKNILESEWTLGLGLYCSSSAFVNLTNFCSQYFDANTTLEISNLWLVLIWKIKW